MGVDMALSSQATPGADTVNLVWGLCNTALNSHGVTVSILQKAYPCRFNLGL